MDFLPAKNKLEAVVRISNLTNSGPEELGPGSKEHKSVLINLANGLKIGFDESLTKQKLARHIAESLGGGWDDSFESVGQTITLSGLNLLLELASMKIEQDDLVFHDSFADTSLDNELFLIAEVLKVNTPIQMDGKKCIQEMKDLEDSRANQVQWQGFYFEMKAETALTAQLGGGRAKRFNTVFDYVRNFTWDLKAHSSVNEEGKTSTTTLLNDCSAVDDAVQDGGIGFIILTGLPTYDREFTKWHKVMRGGGSGEPKRTLKSHFRAERLDIFYVENQEQFNELLESKIFTITKQGKNSNGLPRPNKYSLNLDRAIGSAAHRFTYAF